MLKKGKIGSSSICNILRKNFGLKYKRAGLKNTNYLNTEINSKRLWITRLVSTLLLESSFIVSVDESAIKSSLHPTLRWTHQPLQKHLFKEPKRKPKLLNLLDDEALLSSAV